MRLRNCPTRGNYRCIATNPGGIATSLAATLNVTNDIIPAQIVTEPVSVSLNAPSAATFSIIASGTAPISYQWQKNGVEISGATSSSFTIATSSGVDAGNYRCIISNKAGSDTSLTGQLKILNQPNSAYIVTDPISLTANTGTFIEFNITASGESPITYQWQKNGVDLYNVYGNGTFKILNVKSNDAGSYRCIVSNSVGKDTSEAALLRIGTELTPPRIIKHPDSFTAQWHTKTSIWVSFGGSDPVTYQWEKNQIPIPGATSQTLRFESIETSDAGKYRCIAINSVGKVITDEGVLTVSNPPEGVQEIPLKAGWNIISCSVIPTDASAPSVFAEIGSLSVVKDDAGKSYIPGKNNAIGSISTTKAYRLYCTSADTLHLNGTRSVATTTTLTLKAGWNLIPYLPTTAQPVEQILGKDLGKNLLIAKDETGKSYIPGKNNSLGNMQPGRGYLIYIQDGRTFTYSIN